MYIDQIKKFCADKQQIDAYLLHIE